MWNNITIKQKINYEAIERVRHLYNGIFQGWTNCAHSDERARSVHAKRFSRARKSIKTLLGSTHLR